MTLLARVPDRRDEAESSLCNQISLFYHIISMVFNDIASDTRARYRGNILSIVVSIYVQKYFCKLQNCSRKRANININNNIKSAISPSSFLKRKVILFKFFI